MVTFSRTGLMKKTGRILESTEIKGNTPANICSKSIIETLEKDIKYVVKYHVK